MNYPTSPRKETSSVSKLTVEYLKKFGQNRDLQQYFVLSTPLPKSDENLNVNTQLMETKIPASILIGSKKVPLWSDAEFKASTSRTPACEYQKTFDNENIDTGRLSSASSVISDKRLEWDSGADVGYVNYYNSKHKEKSLSLPALSTIESSRDNSLSSNSCASKKQTFVESTPAHTTGTNTHKFFQQNETEITAIPIENLEENVTNNLQKDKSVSLEDTRLKPESSPKKSLSQIDLSNIEKSSSIIENMYIFSPMFIKTLKGNQKDGETDKKSDKIIQTTLEKVSKLSSNTSDVELFESACETNPTGEFSSRNKTNSGIQIPTSSSFEYIPGNKYNLSGFGASSSNENQASPKDNQNQVNTSDLDLDPKLVDINTSRSSNSSNHTQDSSGHSIGSILMASQYSTDLTKDLEHTVSAMRNIIEAKQYNEIDKKRLIRKIVKKIVNTHYDDDTVPQSPGPNPASHSSENDKISTNHSDSPPDNITSPTVLISKVHTRYSNNVSPEMISSPPLIEMDTSFKSDRIDEENVNNDDDVDEEVPQQNLIEQVCWKKDITFSEQLFAERIKNLQIQRKRHHRDRDKKKKQRNIFTNVEELHKKFMSNDYGGDTTITNKQLLKISEKERENQLNWVKSEIYYLNQLRLLLEDHFNDQASASVVINPTTTTTTTTTTHQVYAVFSNSIKNTSSSSLSSASSSESQSEIGNIRPSSTLSTSSSNYKSSPPNAKQNEIDKIIQKNYIFTESSNKSNRSRSGRTDRDLQSKIIANIKDAQAKEIWKLDQQVQRTVAVGTVATKSKNRRLKNNKITTANHRSILESIEAMTTNYNMAYADSNLCKESEFSGRTLGVELDLPSNQPAQSTVGAETLVKSKNDRLKTNKITTTNHQESESSGELLELDSSTKSTFNDHKQSRTATNSSRSSYEEKHDKQRNIMKHHPQLAVKVNPTVAIQTETYNENVQRNDVDCFSKEIQDKSQVGENLVCSNSKKYKQRPAHLIGDNKNMIVQHYNEKVQKNMVDCFSKEIQENKSQVEENLVCFNSKKHKQRPPHLIGDNTNMTIQHCNENLKKNCIDCYSKKILENKGQVEENFVCSNSKKHKQRPPHVIGDNTNMIVQHCRNSSTQTSDQKITDNNSSASSSSEQYPCKCCKSVKVNQATQTYCKSSSSSKNKYSNEEAKNTTDHKHKTKNQLTSLTLNTNSSSYNSSPSSERAPAPVPQQPTNLNYKRCTCSQQSVHSKNSTNQPTSPSLYLPLKSSTTESQQNSSRQFSKTSSFASPEIVPESGTNSIEFIKNTHKPPSVPVAQKFISNYKSRESSSNSKERQYAHDTNLINYKTWPSHLESMKKVLDMDKFVPSSDRIVQQNTNNLKFTRKPSSRTSKDSEYEHNVEKYSSDSTDKSIDIMDKYLTMTKKCACKQVEDPLPVPSPSQLDVRNDPSCYSTSNYNTQLPDSRSQNSRGLCEDLSKESHGFKDSPAASLSHHIYSNHSSIHYYSRRTSSEIITAEDVAEQNITTKHDDDDEGEYEEEQLHLRSSTSAECVYDHSKCNCIATASSQLHLHKRIQQMLNRCTTCSEQQQQQTSNCYNKPQIKYCSDCYCQCLLYFNSNQQQQSLLCNSCKLKQQQLGGGTRRNHNSIAYFLRIESRDDLILEEEATNCNQQNKSTTIEQVKIYIPKLIKNNSGHLISNKNQNNHHNHVKYVEEIGFNHNEKSFQSLQEYLSKNKPEFIDAAADRQQYLKEISEKRHKHTNTNSNMNTRKNHTAETNYKSKKTKIFSSRKMKEITYRKYRTLPEVQQKMYNMKLFRQRRANRLMMELFNKKLQQKVHKGELDLSLTKTLL